MVMVSPPFFEAPIPCMISSHPGPREMFVSMATLNSRVALSGSLAAQWGEKTGIGAAVAHLGV